MAENKGLSIDRVAHVASDVEDYALEKADHVIHVSQSQAITCGRLFKSNVIYNGVSKPDIIKDISLGFPGKNPIKALYIGRLVGQKNLKALLNAKLPHNVDLIVAGPPKGSDGGVMQLLQQKKMMKRVKFIMWGQSMEMLNGNYFSL